VESQTGRHFYKPDKSAMDALVSTETQAAVTFTAVRVGPLVSAEPLLLPDRFP